MDAAIAQLAVVEVRLLGTLTSQFGNARHRLALTLALLDFILQNLSHVLVDMQIVIHLLLQEIAHILVDGFAAIRSHRGATQLNLRLTLEHRFLYVQGDGSHQSVSDVAILILAKELLDGLGYMLLKGTLMGSALGGVLAVYEGIVFLAILVGMGKGYLDVFALHVDNLIEALIGHIVRKKILQTMTAEDAAAIVHDGKTGVQISIVAEHGFHDVVVEGIVLEEGVIRLKIDESTILIFSILGNIALQNTFLKLQMAHLSLAERLHLEMRAEGVHRLHTHSVQADTLLERLAVVLTTGIQHAHSLDKFTLRNTTTIVAHADPQMIFDINLQSGASPHLELIDRVIYHLFQEYVDSILRQVTITQTTNVHTRTSTYMLHITQVSDVVIGIFYRLLLLWGFQFTTGVKAPHCPCTPALVSSSTWVSPHSMPYF